MAGALAMPLATILNLMARRPHRRAGFGEARDDMTTSRAPG
jgi:hypothetical protein